MSIPEVRDDDSLIRKATSGRQGISLLTTDTPSADHPYYRIEVGQNRADRFMILHIFYYHPADGSFKIEDNLQGDMVTLEEYRKRHPRRR